MSKPVISECFDRARMAVEQIDQIQSQYQQGRELHSLLSSGQSVNGVLYLQTTNGAEAQPPMQLPLPDSEALLGLIAHGAVHLKTALRDAWQSLADTSATALAALQAASPQPVAQQPLPQQPVEL